MHTFSTKNSEKRIEMFIHDGILKDAKRVFQSLKKLTITEGDEVVWSAESSAQLSHHSYLLSPRLVSAWRRLRGTYFQYSEPWLMVAWTGVSCEVSCEVSAKLDV